MPQQNLFNPATAGHRLRLELVDHTMSRSGEFIQLHVSVADLDADYRTFGLLRYPERFGRELIDGDIRTIVETWQWGHLGGLIRYIARQQRQIDAYCRDRLLQ